MTKKSNLQYLLQYPRCKLFPGGRILFRQIPVILCCYRLCCKSESVLILVHHTCCVCLCFSIVNGRLMNKDCGPLDCSWYHMPQFRVNAIWFCQWCVILRFAAAGDCEQCCICFCLSNVLYKIYGIGVQLNAYTLLFIMTSLSPRISDEIAGI